MYRGKCIEELLPAGGSYFGDQVSDGLAKFTPAMWGGIGITADLEESACQQRGSSSRSGGAGEASCENIDLRRYNFEMDVS